MTATLELSSILTVAEHIYPKGVPANDCAGFTNQVGRYFVSGWAPRGDVSTAYRAGHGSHPTGDYEHISSAPDNALVFFKQKQGRGILGMTPPDPGHVGPMVQGKFVSVTSFKYGVALSADYPNVRIGTVAQYLALNRAVEFWMWTPDYAGASLAPTARVISATERVAGPQGVNAHSGPSTTDLVLPANFLTPNGVADFGAEGRGYVLGKTVTVGSVTSNIWYTTGKTYFAAAAFATPPSTEGLTNLTPVPVTTPTPTTEPSDPDPVVTPPDTGSVPIAPADPAPPADPDPTNGDGSSTTKPTKPSSPSTPAPASNPWVQFFAWLGDLVGKAVAALRK